MPHEKSSALYLCAAANDQDRQLSEKFGLLTSHRSMDSFEMMPQNSSSRDPLAISSGKEKAAPPHKSSSRRESSANGRFHFLRQWFVGGGVELQHAAEGRLSPYEDEEEDVQLDRDIELRRLEVSSSHPVDEFVDDGVDLDFEEEINDLVAATYPHYSEALEAAVELQSLRRREIEFGSDSSSLQQRGTRRRRRGGNGCEGEMERVVVQRSGWACFRAPSEEYEPHEEFGGGGESNEDECQNQVRNHDGEDDLRRHQRR